MSLSPKAGCEAPMVAPLSVLARRAGPRHRNRDEAGAMMAAAVGVRDVGEA